MIAHSAPQTDCATADTGDVVLAALNVSKSFGAVQALTYIADRSRRYSARTALANQH
jgi:hypothetical protein